MSIDKDEIEKLQRKWVEGVNPNSKELVIVSADGKTMRGSSNYTLDKITPSFHNLHLHQHPKIHYSYDDNNSFYAL